jgi:hypothetical protein
MARFFKHVGEHNGKKVVIIEKSIPGEPHMCAVIYSTNIPTKFHDDIMKLLESPEGQSEREFGLILNRRISSDGRNLLQAIAQEGYLKKAPCNQVIVKPNASSAIRLDELNNLLKMAGEGEEAIAKLEKLDRESGFKDTRKNPAVVEKTTSASVSGTDVMDDTALAANYVSQATRMKAEAQSLLAEAQRLEEEATKLNPTLAKKKATKSGKSSKVAA